MLPPHDKHCVDGSWKPDVLEEFTGTYAVVAVDPVASVRFLDADATAAAAELKAQKYIALVRPKYGWYDASHTPHYELDLYFVGRGLPSHPELDMDESMSVPIYPTKEHPQSRPPLHPSHPLPWTNCYHHTIVQYTQGDAGRIYTSEKATTTVAQSVTSELRAICSKDIHRVAEISYAKYDDPASEDENTDDDVSSVDDGGSVASPPHSADIIEDILMNPQGLCVTFDIWLDLGVLSDVPDPVEFHKELSSLHMLKTDWQARQKAKYIEMKAQRKEMQARTGAWAQQLESEQTDLKDLKRESADVKSEQAPLAQSQNPVQAVPSLGDDSAPKDAKLKTAETSDSLSASNSCFGRVTALTSSWTKKLRIVCAKSCGRVIRIVTSSRIRNFPHKERTSA